MLRRDGTQIRCMRSPPASFSGLRETRASGPGAGREVGLEEGDAEVYSGKRHRSRSNSALPAFGSQATRLPLQIINPPSPRGELARFSREFPHNCFRVAPMGEAAVSDMALVSGLVSAGP